MGLFDGMLGNASRIDPGEAAREYGRLLSPDEHIRAAYLLIRDAFLFSDRRLILVDKQGLTGKKVEYHTIPYKSITHGREAAVLISPEDLAQMEETLSVLGDPEALADIREADEAYSRGDVVRGADAVRRLLT